MPCHPDRVRRNYQPMPPRDWTDPACSVCDSNECSHVLSERGHPFEWRRPSATAAEQLERRGMTANVIEGDHHDDSWGV